MRRRDYLGLTGVALAGLAGCAEESDEIDDPQDEDDSGSDDTPTEEPTPTEPSGEPNVQFGDSELVIDDSGVTTDAYAEVIVENVGDGPTGQVTVAVEWYDADGNYLDDNAGQLPSLDAGETWVAQVSAPTSDPENIDSIEVSGEFKNSPPVGPEGMKVAESELEIAEFESIITGVAENRRDDEIGYVEAHGKIYDDQGRVIGGAWTNETDIPAGTDWAFEIILIGRADARAEDAADHVALLDADVIRDTSPAAVSSG